jgi:hypothetical protein
VSRRSACAAAAVLACSTAWIWRTVRRGRRPSGVRRSNEAILLYSPWMRGRMNLQRAVPNSLDVKRPACNCGCNSVRSRSYDEVRLCRIPLENKAVRHRRITTSILWPGWQCGGQGFESPQLHHEMPILTGLYAAVFSKHSLHVTQMSLPTDVEGEPGSSSPPARSALCQRRVNPDPVSKGVKSRPSLTRATVIRGDRARHSTRNTV